MLLVECNVLEKVEVINEGTEGNTRLRLRGKFQQCDEQNNNGRIHPRKILEAQVQAIQEKIGDRSLVGALDHPANDAIHLSQASHLITGLSIGKDGAVIGECEILSTPNGKIVEALINDGVKIGISSRGVGSVTEGIKGKIVNEDFKLITFDLVSDPSTRGAFPELSESMRENSQRAQEIVSKHKQDRVLLTMLESKISEALKGKQKKLDKNNNNKIDAEDFEIIRGEKKKKRKDEKSFPDLSGDGKTTFKDILIGRGVFKKGKKKKKKSSHNEAVDRSADPSDDYIISRQKQLDPKKKKKKKKTGLGEGRTPAKTPPKPKVPYHTGKMAGQRKPGEKMSADEKAERDRIAASMARTFSDRNSIEIDATPIIEAFKKVCWGDRYDEGKIKNDPEAFKRAKAADDKKKSYVQRDQERQAKLQQVIADRERRRIAAGGAGSRDQSKP